MCRHLAYLGPPATLRSVVIEPPHGLYRQAWAPRRQRYGTVNADGFGVGWYGARGDERLDENAAAGDDFEAQVVTAWEREAAVAEELGLRVVITRTGVVLSREGGALEKMLPPFRLGIGGPVAGGRQYVSWVHLDDAAGGARVDQNFSQTIARDIDCRARVKIAGKRGGTV